MTPETYGKLHSTLLCLSAILAVLGGVTGNYWFFALTPVTYFGAVWASDKLN